MKASAFPHSLLRAAVFASISFASVYQPAIAQEPRKDVSKEINDLRGTVESAEVYLVSRDAVFRRDLSEREVVRMTCKRAYFARGQHDTDELIDVLVNANLVEVPADKDGVDPRIVVYLFRSNSPQHALVLSRDYNNPPAHGEYRRGVASPVSVEARGGIEKGLRAWAAQHEALVTDRCRG